MRRLVVALSRARLGLYIFARVDQFANCQELRPAFDRLLGRRGLGPNGETRPAKLHLTPWETWKNPRTPESSDLRQLSGVLKQKPVVMDDMPQMATYVSKLYEERMKDLVSQYAATKGSRRNAPPPKILPKEIGKISISDYTLGEKEDVAPMEEQESKEGKSESDNGKFVADANVDGDVEMKSL